MRSTNIGKFLVADHMLRFEPDLVAEVFARLKIVPVRIESLWQDLIWEYTALSSWFAEVPVGDCVPTYLLILERDAGGKLVDVVVERAQKRKSI